MKAPILAVLLASVLVLSGCILAPEDDLDHDHDHGHDHDGGHHDDDPGSGGHSASGSNGNTSAPAPPHAAIAASNVTGTVPFSVSFDLSSDSASAEWLDWTFDANGDGTNDKTGYGLPAQVVFEFTEPGYFTATLSVTDIDGREGNATLLITAVAPPPVVLPDPIVIEGTITGFPFVDEVYSMSDSHMFNLSVVVERMTLTFEVGPTAFDLDFEVLTPDGKTAGSVADINEPTGLFFSPADSPIVIDDPDHLAQLGEWTVIVHPFLAIEGDYTITITFE
jgi:hypothetical protein